MPRDLAALLLLTLAVGPTSLVGEPPPATSRPAQPLTTGAARGPVLFQRGVWIDWTRHEVQVETRVVLRAGALEFLACWPGKEHESIVRCEASAVHVYMALGLVGLLPGHPPEPDPETDAYGPPTGDLIDISFRWEEDGRSRTLDAWQWLREIEYERTPLARPWIFAGSQRLSDGSLSVDKTGVGVALVDFPDSLVCVTRRYSSRNSELWAEANTPVIPPEGTPVRMVLRAATARHPRVMLDFRGVAWVDGRYCSAADLADLLVSAGQLEPTFVQTIELSGMLDSDVRTLRGQLSAGGVPAEALCWLSAAPDAAECVEETRVGNAGTQPPRGEPAGWAANPHVVRERGGATAESAGRPASQPVEVPVPGD